MWSLKHFQGVEFEEGGHISVGKLKCLENHHASSKVDIALGTCLPLFSDLQLHKSIITTLSYVSAHSSSILCTHGLHPALHIFMCRGLGKHKTINHSK